mgnify:CR=1 FL=1
MREGRSGRETREEDEGEGDEGEGASREIQLR